MKIGIPSRLWAAVVLIALHGPACFADLVLSLTPSSATIAEGASGYLDVFINGDTGDALDAFLAQLQITGGSGLQFTDPQAESHLGIANYVFDGRSNSVITGSPTTSFPSLLTINVGDISDDGSNAPLTGGPDPFGGWVVGSPRLLARIDFQALAGGAGSYTVGIVSGNTSFTDDALDPIPFNAPSVGITVAPVPEPSSMVMVTFVAAGAFVLRRLRVSAFGASGR